MMEKHQAFLGRELVESSAEFMGRQAELQWIADKLSRPMPQNCNIIGEPRIGKTSLLYHVYQEKIGLPDGAVGLYVWIRLVELTDYRSAAFWRFLLQQLFHALRQAGHSVESAVLHESDADQRDLFDVVDETVEAVLAAGEITRIIFVIDDFDALVPGIRTVDLDWLRSLATRFGDAVGFVIGSTDSLLAISERAVRHADQSGLQMVSPFANIFHNLQLGLLTRAEAEALCHFGSKVEAQDALSPGEIGFLLNEAGRHPDLLKVALGHFFPARQISEPDELFEDVQSDFRFDSHVRWLCNLLFSRRGDEEKQALFALAQETAVSTDPVILNRLKRQLGLVEKRNGRLALFSDAFRHWTQRQSLDEMITEPGETAVQPPEEPTLDYIPASRTVRLSSGEEVRLTPLENRLLVYFLEHVNTVCTIDELLANVWGPNKSRGVVEKGVNRLRVKIEQDPKRPRFILSARGEGYLLRRR